LAPRRRIHGGKSQGRAQALISFALEYWEEIGSWCYLRGVDDIWNIPSYKFAGLVLAYLKDDKTSEGLAEIDNLLANADELDPPFKSPQFRLFAKAMASVLGGVIEDDKGVSKSSKIQEEIIAELPTEERKRREAEAAGKAYRVPEWWRGERANYKIASSMMGTLPKKIGPIENI
jgi:hypothetical protein